MLPKNEEDAPRVNEEIAAVTGSVLLVDENGVKVGETDVNVAIYMAMERSLDLVEVAPMAKPPVCRIMDYGKYRYQLQKKEKDARKKQKVQALKEMKMRPKIDEHDFDFKLKAIKNFLLDGHRVKVSVFFRGREMAFLNRGEEVLNRVIAECTEVGKCEGTPQMEGRYMRILLTPLAGAAAKPAQSNNKANKAEKANKKADKAEKILKPETLENKILKVDLDLELD
ncbi:MAG: translation initiation factor IF-3 [Synergistaceae bacterium]|nr:translation initiation factor IF-3 [Synergistaceae bacterium]